VGYRRQPRDPAGVGYLVEANSGIIASRSDIDLFEYTAASWVPPAVETSAWVARQKAGTTLSVLVAELLAGSAYATRTSG